MTKYCRICGEIMIEVELPNNIEAIFCPICKNTENIEKEEEK